MKRKLFFIALGLILAGGFMFFAGKKGTSKEELIPIIEKFLSDGTYIKFGTNYPVYRFKENLVCIAIYDNELSIEYKDNIHSDFVISRFYFKLDENNNLIILDIND